MTDARLRALERRAGTGDVGVIAQLKHISRQAGQLPYQQVEFETLACRKEGKSEKASFSFDQSLAKLRERGYERHPRSVEMFSLLSDHLEERLGNGVQEVAVDMLENYGEWVSLAWERKGDVLIAYVDPVGLVWDEQRREYVRDNFDCAQTQEFDITGKQSRHGVDLKEFGREFVVAHYGVPFDELPVQMREGDRRAQAYLTPEGIVWPVGRGNYNYWHYLLIDGSSCNFKASRGVVTPQKISSGSEGCIR